MAIQSYGPKKFYVNSLRPKKIEEVKEVSLSFWAQKVRVTQVRRWPCSERAQTGSERLFPLARLLFQWQRLEQAVTEVNNE